MENQDEKRSEQAAEFQEALQFLFFLVKCSAGTSVAIITARAWGVI